MRTIKNKKRISAIAAIAMVVVVATTTLLYSDLVLADRRLTGLDTLIQKKTSATETFKILEIVEDKGEIGFYFEGNEPFSLDEDGYALDFETTLANMTNTSERKAYVSALLEELEGKYYTAGGSGTASAYPISYNPYDETYFTTDESAWDWIEFEENKHVKIAGEYVEVEQNSDGTANYGDYTRNGKFTLAYDFETGSYNGTHMENLLGFDSESDEKSYNVTFGTEQKAEYLYLGVYTRVYEKAGVAETEAAFNALKEQNEGKYWILAKDGVTYVEIDLNDYTYAEIGAIATEQYEITNKTDFYKIDGYKYAGTTSNDSNTQFYYVQSFSYAYNGLEFAGEYGAILRKGEEQYREIRAGEIGTHKESDCEYSYTPGIGTHNFVPNTDKPEVLVEVEGFYYKGGFVNNNWFRNKVFMSKQEDISLNLLPVSVRTLTVEELCKECSTDVTVFNDIDMLVINGDSDMFKNGSVTVLTQIADKLESELRTNKLATIINKQLVAAESTSPIIKKLRDNYYTESKTSTIGSVDNTIYWYSGDLFNTKLGEEISSTEATAGFSDVLNYIKAENKYLGLRNEEKIPEKVSQAIAIQYILSCKYERNIAPKQNVTVLEIQPCADFSLSKTQVRNMTGYTELSDDAIKIVKMTTAEFVGKIHDLNGVYDFIYFGMNTDLMNTDTDGNTIYNDSSMNGFVYTHTGDAVIAAERLTGLLDTDFVDDAKNANDIPRNNLPYSRDVYMIRTSKEDGKLVQNTLRIPYAINTPGKNQVKTEVIVGNQGVYRYSGNDITAENVEMLEDYVDAGYPIILDSKFAVAGTTYDSKTKANIDTTKLDNSTYLYEFLDYAFEKQNVFLNVDALSTNPNFKFYMNLPKLQLTFYENSNDETVSEYYVPDNTVTDHYADSTEKFVKKVDGKYYLTYAFSIRDEASTSVLDTNYKVSLFIDINSDGKYSREHEMMKDIKVTEEDGRTAVAADKLVANKIYVVTRRIPDAFRSVVPWKLEVSLVEKTASTNTESGNEETNTEEGNVNGEATDNEQTSSSASSLTNDVSLIRKSQIGYSKLETDTETDIEIYQILSDKKGDDQNRDNNTWNLEADYAKKDYFYDDIESLDEYNLYFTTDYVSEYQNQNPNGKDWTLEDTTDPTGKYYDSIKGYDMLIIGFADVYEGFTNPYAVEAILQFIESGKTVLFTHDTTSFVNYPGGTADNIDGENGWGSIPILSFLDNSDEAIGGERWGYLLNQIVRDKLGMDRYGITNPDKFIEGSSANASAQDGWTTDEAKILLETLLKKGKILDTTKAVSTYIQTEYTGTVADLFELAEKEAAYVVGSNREQTYPETHGYTYTTINNCEEIIGDNSNKETINNKSVTTGTHTSYLNLNSTSGVTNLGKTWAESFNEFFGVGTGNGSIWDEIFGAIADFFGKVFDELFGNIHNGSFNKMTVTCVNKGQITEYPFKIDETLSVASTHAQYYQLDLAADQDNDGESDIVVWYCISDGYNGSATKANPYSASPNDVRNNYYIYSIGNVFYTGAGHKSVNQAEKRLFINTMIAAYNASVNEPSVTVLEEENITAAELSSMNMPMEYSLASEGQKSYIGDTTIEIPYSVYDDNFVYASDTVKKLSVEYFIEDANGDTTINGVNVKKLNNITTTQNKKTVSKIESGKAYTAVWKPTATELYNYISNNESVHIYIRVKAEFVYNDENTVLYGHDTLALKKTNMFELD